MMLTLEQNIFSFKKVYNVTEGQIYIRFEEGKTDMFFLSILELFIKTLRNRNRLADGVGGVQMGGPIQDDLVPDMGKTLSWPDSKSSKCTTF